MSMVIDAEIRILNNPDMELKGEAWLKGASEDGGSFSPWNTLAVLDGGSFWSGGDAVNGEQFLKKLFAIDMVIVY